MRNIKIAGFFLCAVLLLGSCAGKTLIETVETSVKEVGGRKTLEKYFPCETYESGLYQNIRSGDPRWIQLAVELLDFSDACYTEEIQASLGQVMGKNPENILPYVNQSSLLSANKICLPFISEEQSTDRKMAEVENIKRSIAKVKDTKLAVQQQACLEVLEDIENQLRSVQ